MKILAKSHNDITLNMHTAHVMEGCEVFFSLVGVDLLKMYRIDLEESRFLRLLRVAAILHDVGKANDHFQRMITTGEILQAYRHESVSYAAMRHPEIHRWLLRGLTTMEFALVSWAVAGHHRKFPPDVQDHPTGLMTVYYDHEEVTELLVKLQDLLDLPDLPILREITYDVAKVSMRCFTCEIGETCGNCPPRLADILASELIPATPDLQNISACLKACLIMGDVLGSIQDKHPEDLRNDLLDILSRTFSSEDADRIVDKRRRDKDGNIKWPLSQLQTKIAESPHRVTLIESGCGGGKTVVGYRWARKHAHNRKLYFCYPTMGTATTGYSDYIQEENSSLVHSTAWLELLKLAPKQSELSAGVDAGLMESFRVLGYPLISCTADTVLGLLQNYHLSLVGCAGLANGSFVFDEIHSYDPKMWKALLRFIQFDLPCLLMTASLPEYRVQELEEALTKVGETLNKPDSRGDLEAAPRYTLPAPMSQSTGYLWSVIERAIANKQKVLWISNTIDSCIGLYEEAVARGYQPLCYHARFKTRDRLNSHQTLVDTFKESTEGVLAFTTQVAEMSLDLTADILITDLAPISAIIQRLGRLNRDLLSIIGTCYILPGRYPNGKLKTLPYEEHDILEAIRWIEALPRKAKLSQDDLIDVWRTIDITPIEPDLDSLKHIDSPEETRIGCLRKTDGVNLEIVLEEDVEDVGAGRVSIHDVKIRVHVFGLKDYATWTSYTGYTYIPPSGTFSYSKERGARWNKSPGT